VTKFEPVIAPGEQGTVTVDLRTRGMPAGAVSKAIALKSNDPARPFIPLVIKAEIQGRVRVVNRDMSEPIVLPMEETEVAELTLQTTDGEPLEITGVSCDAKYVTAEIASQPSDDPKRKSYGLTLRIGPEAPTGRTTVSILLATTSSAERVVALNLWLDKGIAVTPPRILLRADRGDPDQVPSAAFTLENRDRDFQIVKIAGEPFAVESKIEVIRAGREYRVTVLGKASDKLGVQQGLIRIETDDSRQPQLEIRAAAFFPGRRPNGE
jgi:hypothetical protein